MYREELEVLEKMKSHVENCIADIRANFGKAGIVESEAEP
jgi:hypothetical protein